MVTVYLLFCGTWHMSQAVHLRLLASDGRHHVVQISVIHCKGSTFISEAVHVCCWEHWTHVSCVWSTQQACQVVKEPVSALTCSTAVCVQLLGLLYRHGLLLVRYIMSHVLPS